MPLTLRVVCLAVLFEMAATGQESLPSPAMPETSAAVGGDRPERGLTLGENRNATQRGEVGDWQGPAKFIRAHWVRMNLANELQGTIATIDPQSNQLVPSAGLEVELYRDGERFSTAVVSEDGSFTMSGLEPGVYAMIARGERGFLAYGLHLLPALGAPQAGGRDPHVRLIQQQTVAEALQIRSAAVPPTFNTLRRILTENFEQITNQYVPAAAYLPFLEEAARDQEPGSETEQGADRFRGTRELASGAADGQASVPATSVDSHLVQLGPDSVMYGRLYGIDAETGRPMNVSDVTVHVIQDDSLVDSVAVDDEGYFQTALFPGVYSLVAAGRDGFGAVSFRAVAVPAEREARRRPVPVHLSALQLAGDDFAVGQDEPGAGGAGVRNAAGDVTAFPFAMALIHDPRVIQQAMRQVPAVPLAGSLPPPVNMPLAPGTTGASGGFASGGASGGGWGGLLGAAGLATGATALATGNNRIPPEDRPTSPDRLTVSQ